MADEIHSSGSGRFQHHEFDMFVFSRKQSDLLVMDFPAQGMLKAALTALALEPFHYTQLELHKLTS